MTFFNRVVPIILEPSSRRIGYWMPVADDVLTLTSWRVSVWTTTDLAFPHGMQCKAQIGYARDAFATEGRVTFDIQVPELIRRDYEQLLWLVIMS